MDERQPIEDLFVVMLRVARSFNFSAYEYRDVESEIEQIPKSWIGGLVLTERRF